LAHIFKSSFDESSLRAAEGGEATPDQEIASGFGPEKASGYRNDPREPHIRGLEIGL
jgi:hypothetical protein